MSGQHIENTPDSNTKNDTNICINLKQAEIHYASLNLKSKAHLRSTEEEVQYAALDFYSADLPEEIQYAPLSFPSGNTSRLENILPKTAEIILDPTNAPNNTNGNTQIQRKKIRAWLISLAVVCVCVMACLVIVILWPTVINTSLKGNNKTNYIYQTRNPKTKDEQQDDVTITSEAYLPPVMYSTEKVKRRRTNLDLINATLILKKSVNSYCKQILTVEDHPWCMRKKSIIIYDQDLQTVNKVQLDDILYDMIDITRVYSGHVVLACRNTGLHEINPDGQYVAHILKGKVFACFSFQKAVYAILSGNFIIKSGAVILTQENSTWVKSKPFKLQFFLWQIKANHNTIYAKCLREPRGKDTVFILDNKLNIIDSFLSREFNLYSMQYQEIDSGGNMILTDESKENVIILQKYGKLHMAKLKLNLRGIWCISYSKNGNLWISTDRQLYKYTVY